MPSENDPQEEMVPGNEIVISDDAIVIDEEIELQRANERRVTARIMADAAQAAQATVEIVQQAEQTRNRQIREQINLEQIERLRAANYGQIGRRQAALNQTDEDRYREQERAREREWRESEVVRRGAERMARTMLGLPETASASNTVQVEFDETTVSSRAVERPEGYWKLRNGKFILISEMTDQHLENCIQMCRRNSLSRGRIINNGGVYAELMDEFNHRLRQRQAQIAELSRNNWFIQNIPPANSIPPPPPIQKPEKNKPARRIKS